MKRALYIQREVEQVGTIKDMTSIFEAIASIHISQIKDKVMRSTAFFDVLWETYGQLLAGEKDYTSNRKPAITDRPALVIITSDGGLIGDIDERIVNAMAQHPQVTVADVYSIGAHGTALLARRGIQPKQSFALPNTDVDINVTSISRLVDGYKEATVYYQRYVSLLKQEVAHIDLFSAVNALGTSQGANKGVISRKGYLFEPSLDDIVAYMESVMVDIALGQMVLESKLAQYASRFNTMSAAQKKAKDLELAMKLSYNRARRGQADERIKEVLSGMKAMQRVQNG